MILLKYRIHFFLFLISIFCILFINLNYTIIESIEGISTNLFLSLVFKFLTAFSSIFTILFLPTFPIFFIKFKHKNIKFREKISFTIVSNLSFYILLGFLGIGLRLYITFFYFSFMVTVSYFLIVLIIFIQEYLKGINIFLIKLKRNNNNRETLEKHTILSYVRDFFSLNGILLYVFIFLVCWFFIVITRFFISTDPWLHISIIKYITEVNYIPLNEYFGSLGFHIFGAVIHFFSGLDIILIPKYFVLYTIPLGSLIVYNLLMRIFRNKNLAIFGVFLLLISSLGFIHLLTQFWPSSLVFIQCLIIFFLLYVRLQTFTRESIPKKEVIRTNMLFSYIFSIIIFISSFFTHSLLTMILVFSYLWVYLIYFARNHRRGFDIVLLIIFFGIFLIFYLFNISIGHISAFNPFSLLSWYQILLGVLAFTFFETLFLMHYRKSLDFTKGRFKLIIFGKKNKKYKKIEDKYLFPFIFGLILILICFYVIFNQLVFNFDAISIFNAIEILLLSLFAIWGLALFQYKPRGKPLFLWLISLAFIFLIVFLFDATVGVTSFFSRVFYLSSIIISIGFTSYMYKLIKTNSIQHRKFKLFFFFIMIFSFFVSFLQNSVSVEMFSLKEREVNSVQWYINYASSEHVIISEFGWGPIFIYYGYPYEDKNLTLVLGSVYLLLTINESLLHPSLHNLNGANVLKNVSETYVTEVILILPKEFYLPSSWQFFDQLSEEEIEAYYDLQYLNRIFSAKGEDGEETPYYWVI